MLGAAAFRTTWAGVSALFAAGALTLVLEPEDNAGDSWRQPTTVQVRFPHAQGRPTGIPTYNTIVYHSMWLGIDVGLHIVERLRHGGDVGGKGQDVCWRCRG
jgi:hypothetical protein